MEVTYGVIKVVSPQFPVLTRCFCEEIHDDDDQLLMNSVAKQAKKARAARYLSWIKTIDGPNCHVVRY